VSLALANICQNAKISGLMLSPLRAPKQTAQTSIMPAWILKKAVAITTLTFLAWLGFAAIFPDDRLNLGETIFVWTVIALVLLAGRSMARATTRRRTRSGRARPGD
jgi:hypothetical protein